MSNRPLLTCLATPLPVHTPPYVYMLFTPSAAHIVTTSVVAGCTLRVEVETEDGRSRWCGEFAARCEHPCRWQPAVLNASGATPTMTEYHTVRLSPSGRVWARWRGDGGVPCACRHPHRYGGSYTLLPMYVLCERADIWPFCCCCCCCFGTRSLGKALLCCRPQFFSGKVGWVWLSPRTRLACARMERRPVGPIRCSACCFPRIPGARAQLDLGHWGALVAFVRVTQRNIATPFFFC